MEFIPIFADPNDKPLRGFYAVRFDDMSAKEDTWSLFIDEMSDPTFRRKFMKARQSKLLTNGYFGTYTVSDASERALEEFLDITDELRDAYSQDIKNLLKLLNQRFHPLVNTDTSSELLKSKAKPKRPKEPWVRLYAVKVSNDLYLFSGGAIKLVRYMDDDEATKKEKRNLERLRDGLKELGLYDQDAYTELEL